MKPTALLLFALVLFGSCCDKVYCDVAPPTAQIRIVYHGYTCQEAQDAKVYILDSSYHMLDYARNNFGDSTMYIFQGLFATQYLPFNSYIYVSEIAARRDTISGINYDVVHDRVKCGKCYFEDNYDDITRYVNVRYDYKGVTQLKDSLVVNK